MTISAAGVRALLDPWCLSELGSRGGLVGGIAHTEQDRGSNLQLSRTRWAGCGFAANPNYQPLRRGPTHVQLLHAITDAQPQRTGTHETLQFVWKR